MERFNRVVQRAAVALALVGAGVQIAAAQDRIVAAPAARQNAVAAAPLNGLAPAASNGGQGGSAMADFDSLIDLITATVAAESWVENGTGEGDIQPFAINGVFVDAQGALRTTASGDRPSLAAVRDRGAPQTVAAAAAKRTAAPKESSDSADAIGMSPLRFVSLPRLEAAIAACQARHAPLEPEMLTLAGLQRVSYVLAYPQSGDLVLAGPAGPWQAAPGGGLFSTESGRAVVRLDDLLALWRRSREHRSAPFGCSIVPRREALARTQEFLTASAATPLEPSERGAWLRQLRDALGEQDVVYYAVDRDSRIAGLLLAADYHMKLVGMGLAPGVPGVKSYLATVRLGPDGAGPPMAVLRWWFAMPASTVEAAADRHAFAMPDRCIQVLSENELLEARGERIHTGQSDDLNRQFAASFTREFTALADKYPVYSELQRAFELSLAFALIEREGLAEKVGWTPTLLLDSDRLRLPQASAPRSVQTVINHRVIGGRQIIAGVSGGVWVDGAKNLSTAPATAVTAKKLSDASKPPAPGNEAGRWWWD
jgi:hypothetical protein